jgi:uncharacterized hydrophobic protein (TIGR00271 family)
MSAAGNRLTDLVAIWQNRAAAALGVDETHRRETVVTMLDNNRRRAPGYWIQLTLAMGIATLGLVLNSTAVVIGAMLVSPLMGPIIELGMGFAVGSSFLVLRASICVVLSAVIVVSGAALLSVSLPFHEITGEIAARAAPTALDLMVAVFCALTAAYTTVRATSETTSAAAGTAIGIALVPPLCTVGFGIGIGSASVAGGATLLFTANLSAILVFAVISFLVLGYNQVDAHTFEADFLERDVTRIGRFASGAQTRLHDAFGSKYGLAMRLLIPATFLAAVYVPLRRALNEVTWEVKARAAIRGILQVEAPRAVQTSLSVEQRVVALRLVVVGSMEYAATLQATLGTRIAAATQVEPSVTVMAVPDAKTLAETVTRTDAAVSPPTPSDVNSLRQRTAAALQADWPTAAVGALLGWDIVVSSRDQPTIETKHLGAPLGSAGSALLAASLSTRLGTPIRVVDMPLAESSTAAGLSREREWSARARPILDWVGNADGAVACVQAPIAPSRRLTRTQQEVLATIKTSAASLAGRLTLQDSAGWSVRVAAASCSPGSLP